ncbi:hypothetical protein Tco_0762937 [Tanacetum coccineum]
MVENDPANAIKCRKELMSSRKRASTNDKRSNPRVSLDELLTCLSTRSTHPQPTIHNRMPHSDIINWHVWQTPQQSTNLAKSPLAFGPNTTPTLENSNRQQLTPVASTRKRQTPLKDVSNVSQRSVLYNTINHDDSSTISPNSSLTSGNQVTPVDPACKRCSPLSNVSNEYYDHGDPTSECKECHAFLWEAEAKRGNPNPVNKAYGIC